MEDILKSIGSKEVYVNVSISRLVEEALINKEGLLADNGALLCMTGKYTGRSPKDKFVVCEGDAKKNVSFNDNFRPCEKKSFDELRKCMIKYMKGKKAYVFEGYAGADKKHRRKFRVICEKASQALFINQLLIPKEKDDKDFTPDFTIFACPNFQSPYKKLKFNSEVTIAIDFGVKEAMICGSAYNGEIKKCVFSIMNYILPLEDKVLPMHCSCNMGKDGDTCIFFGLSGTGKTTLSTDKNRYLIGDDEHGWSDDTVFNFEGGCYAKTINLKEENEPDIYRAIRYGAVLENVEMDLKTRKLDFDSSKYTENTRVGYPLSHIDNAKVPSVANIPKVIIFLTADAFGVLPPISRLSKEAAMYHFVTGFTSKVAGTERGIKDPVPTFSTLFGEPFMALNPKIYANMLGDKLDKYGTKVYLVNTGWTGGSYGEGTRMKLSYTRSMITAAITGEFDNATYIHDDLFNLDIPESISNVPSEILNPKNTWKDKDAYDKTAMKLAKMFKENFDKKYKDMNENIKKAGPLG